MLTFELRNIGQGPASGAKLTLVCVTKDLATPGLRDEAITLANDIPPGDRWTQTIHGTGLEGKGEPQYVLVVIDYCDPILSMQLRQRWFLRWDGWVRRLANETRRPAPILHDVQEQEKVAMAAYLKPRLPELLEDPGPTASRTRWHRLIGRGRVASGGTTG